MQHETTNILSSRILRMNKKSTVLVKIRNIKVVEQNNKKFEQSSRDARKPIAFPVQ